MTPLAFVLVIVLAIVLLSVMTLRFKMHPIMVLFLVATLIGVLTGHSIVNTMSLIKQYFGATLTGIGVLIIFGAIIASGISDTGAATSIANFFIRLFRGKRLELAPSLAGFVMSIPVFGDIAIVLNAPISAILAKRKNMSMATMAPFVNLGLTLTHGLVPPTPGILAVTLTLKAELGTVIVVGLLCAIVSFAVCYIIGKPILSRGEFIEPLPEFVEGIEPVPDNAPIEKLTIKEENIPSALSAFAPLLVPVVMIAIGSVASALEKGGSLAADSLIYKVLITIGDSTVALFAGIICVALLVIGRKPKAIKKANEQGYNLSPNTPAVQLVFDNWVVRALKIAIGPLLITAMGGAMGGILRENSAIKEIGEIVASSGFPHMLIPFVIAAILMAVCGSMTTASITAAALILPMLPLLNISPEFAALAIGAGSMCFWHVNNSGFWLFCSLYNFNTRQGLKYFTTMNAFGGIVAFIALCIFSLMGII